MSAITFEILLIILLIVANGIFSGSEIAIVSARKVRLEQLAKRGNTKARAALKLANSPNDFLSAVQIGITLIGILSGAVGGATLASRLEVLLGQVSALAPYREPLSIVIVVGIITYLSLVIGELVPKRIALSNPEQIACTMAKPMRLLAKITSPAVRLLGVSTDAILKLLGIRPSEEQLVTEEEIKVFIEQGARAGLFEVAEQEIVSRVFRLDDRTIRSLMTPRVEIDWLDVNAPLEENQREILASSHSRFPVGQETLDRCLGIVSVKDFLSAYLSGEPIDFRKILQSPLFVHENIPVLDVLGTFRQTGKQMALITDEYGGIEGLVTLNDLIAAIVGNLQDASSGDDPQIVQREDGSWLLDGLLSTDDLKDLLQRDSLPLEEDGDYHTLGGLVMTFFRRVPRSGDHFETEGLRFEVMDMDGNRVDKVLVTFMQSDRPASEQGGSGI
ncbi:MAG: HlyC/CorC family transporter [Cyanobacteria bacterium CRU_2_1]|nr:HlyC/CorC family transporter [Cyanobacteria bacterium RU_5_0]NJR57760.1 HlyC/CorC family transporter [Cyanobacteria bacterium CRU_2_1]